MYFLFITQQYCRSLELP